MTPSLRCLTLLIAATAGHTATAGDLKVFGDIRAEYGHLDRRDRNGSESDVDEVRGRLRVGLESALGERWTARARVAGRYSSEASGHDFFLHGHAPSASGLTFNQATLDELNLHYRGDGFALRLGRLQTKVDMGDLMGRSLLRKDSASTDITWTDGIEVRLGSGTWQQVVHLQRNDRKGTSNAQRPPLAFDRGGSRLSYGYGLESTQARGPLVLRGMYLSYLPDALAPSGISQAGREDYLAISIRAAAAFPLDIGGRFLLAGELAHALDTPTRLSQRLGASGDTGGLGWQLSGNWLGIRPGHDFAVLYARAEAGWLLSPDYSANMDALELRYQWTLTPASAIELRWRRREDLAPRTDLRQTRIDRDHYLRYTFKF